MQKQLFTLQIHLFVVFWFLFGQFYKSYYYLLISVICCISFFFSPIPSKIKNLNWNIPLALIILNSPPDIYSFSRHHVLIHFIHSVLFCSVLFVSSLRHLDIKLNDNVIIEIEEDRSLLFIAYYKLKSTNQSMY